MGQQRLGNTWPKGSTKARGRCLAQVFASAAARSLADQLPSRVLGAKFRTRSYLGVPAANKTLARLTRHLPWQRPSHSSLYRSTAALMISIACPTEASSPSITKVREGRRQCAPAGSVQDLMSQPVCRMMSRTEDPEGPAQANHKTTKGYLPDCPFTTCFWPWCRAHEGSM